MTAAVERRPVVLTVLTGGGFSFETGCLARQVAQTAEIIYLATEYGGSPGSAGLPPGPLYPIESFGTVTSPSRLRDLRAFFSTFRRTLSVIRRHHVDAVAGIGCSQLVPMLLAARLARKPAIYVESITRADRLSRTGRIIYTCRLFTHFFVQWPGLHQALPASRWASIL